MMMKVLLAALGLIASLPCMGQEAEKPKGESPGEHVGKLLDKLPPQSALAHDHWIFEHQGPAGTAEDKEELKRALEEMKLAGELVPKIRALIKSGTSIFDYPGLLAAGAVTYIVISEPPDGKSVHGYRLYIGVALDEGTWPTDFHLFFDEKGIITKIESVIWRQ